MSPLLIGVLALLQVQFDATLLAPVDSQLTFYAAQPGYYALIGIGRDGSAHLIYHDALFARLGDEGFVYVPKQDTGYVRIYFLASPSRLDLSALERRPSAYALDQAIASAPIVEGYDRQPERQFFVLANPSPHTNYQRAVLTVDAREALHPAFKSVARRRRWFAGGGSPPPGNESSPYPYCDYSQCPASSGYTPDYGGSGGPSRVIESGPIGGGPPKLPSSPHVP